VNALVPFALAAAVAVAPAPKATARAPEVRAELDALQAALEAAVAPVSRPAGLMVGRGGRAYHLKGFGTVVVLAPRALPREPRGPQAQEARVRAELARSLEERLAATEDAAERRRLEIALRRVRQDAGADRRIVVRVPPPHGPHPPPFDVEVMVEEAEAFRRAAEEAMERAERDVRFQLRVPEPIPAPPVPPVPVVAPAPEVAPPPRPPLPPGVEAPGHGPDLPFPPPGAFFWFDEGEPAAAQTVVADVRRAIARGLRAHRGRLDHLGPDEAVAVAVDFMPRIADRGAPPRTVVARVKKRDLAAAREGRLDDAGLLARMEFDEY